MSDIPDIPLKVLIIDPDTSASKVLEGVLRKSGVVISVERYATLDRTMALLRKLDINVIYIDPLLLDIEKASEYIFKIRKAIPSIVFVLYYDFKEQASQKELFYNGKRKRFLRYFKLDKLTRGSEFSQNVQSTIESCQGDLSRNLTQKKITSLRKELQDIQGQPEGIEKETKTDASGSEGGDKGTEPVGVAEFERAVACELGTASRRVIETAIVLSSGVGSGPPVVTTSWLVLALAVTGKNEKRGQNTSTFFYERVREKEENVQEAYLRAAQKRLQDRRGKGGKGTGLTQYISPLMKRTKRIAVKTTGENTIHLRHLFAGLLVYTRKGRDTGAHRRLEEMGVDIAEVRGEFLGFLKRSGIGDDMAAWERVLEGIEPKPKKLSAATAQEQAKVEDHAKVEVIGKSGGMSVAEHGWGDRVADKDRLGFRPYVEVVARFLTHEETELPLTLSVEGEWGSGKSSFLTQLKNEIGRIYKDKGPGKTLIVEFDPWRHDKDEALWAAFALKFIADASKCLTKSERWKANCELWKQRLSWKQAWPDVLRIVLVGLAWILATIGICIGLWNGIELGATGTVVLPKWIGSIVALVVSLWAVFGKVKEFLGSPFAVELKKYMRRPDYVSKVSFIEKFHDDFKEIVNAYAGEERVYVFVDDLDRCEVPKAAELMESINLMISENPKLVFVMGMDREKVAAGLAVKHEKLLPYLAESTKNKYLDKEEVKRLRGVRYGYSFIEKFVQVPFSLPQPDEKCINEMLMGMSGQIKEEKKTTGEKQEAQPIAEDMPLKEVPGKSKGEMSQTGKTEVPQTQIEADKKLEAQKHAIRQEQIEEEFLKFDGDNPNFRAIVLTVSKAFDFNPRRAKQFVNIFRLRAATAKVTGLYEPKDGKRLWFEQLGKFIGIGLGWPLFIRDLERNPRLLDKLVDVAEGEKKPEDPDSRIREWAEDERLIGLIKSGCFDKNKKKKTGNEYERFCMRGLDIERLMKVSPRVTQGEVE